MKTRILSLALFLLSVSAYTASGATLTYTPDHAELTVTAGSQDTTVLTVGLRDAEYSTYYLWFLNAVTDGNLPASWISASPSTAFLSRGSTAQTILTVSVPEDTPSGLYSGYLKSRAMASHGYADSGMGMLIEVSVPPLCSGMPSFEIASFGPEFIWPPDHGMETVAITGKAVLPQGCTLVEIGYAIDDEYGVYTSVGTLEPDSDGTFSLAVPVEAWREGQDKDGRHYTITLYAKDEAGTGTGDVLFVTVPHDMSNSK